MKIILILFLVLAPLRMDAARRPCPGVPFVSTTVACRSACGTKFMYDFCIDAMRRGGIDPSPSHTEETTTYAILAGNQTSNSYDSTSQALVTQLQQNKSLSGPERDAYGGCTGDYIEAFNSINLIVVGSLPSCLFTRLGDEYRKGMTSLENCRNRMLAPWLNRPPLYPMVEHDRNSVLLAYLLGKLLGI